MIDMAKGICSIEGCDGVHHARGWCSAHYGLWKNHGDPVYATPTLAERFWAKVDVRGPEDCWLWTGADNGNGYGNLRAGRSRSAHLVAYELAVGPIPEGLQLDHTCHNVDLSCAGGWTCLHRRCCNPSHLEAVAHSVNVARGRSGAIQAARTHCPQGHPYSGANLFLNAGSRRCRACDVARKRVRP